MRCTIIAMAALALAGCGSQPVADSVKAEAPFALNSIAPESAAATEIATADPAEAKAMMISLGSLKGDPFAESTHPDSLSKGEISSATYVNGTAIIYTLPDGRMWQARLYSGYGERCSDALSSADKVAKFVGHFRPEALTSEPTLVPSLVAALKEERVEKITFGRATFTAAGHCVQSLNYKEDDALPSA